MSKGCGADTNRRGNKQVQPTRWKGWLDMVHPTNCRHNVAISSWLTYGTPTSYAWLTLPLHRLETIRMNAISDTSDDAERFQMALLRQRTPTQRVELALRLSDELMLASKQAISRVHPDLTPMQVNLAFIELHYGRELAEAVRHHVENAPHVPSK